LFQGYSPLAAFTSFLAVILL